MILILCLLWLLQRPRLLIHRAAGRRHLLDQRGVLLRALIQLRHRPIDARHALRLLARRGRDLTNDVGHALHAGDDLGHGRARGLHLDDRHIRNADGSGFSATITDATLFIAGKLDPRLGGPAFQDFIIEKPEHSPHYEYHLHDPEDPKSHRRSIYRFLVRSQTQPFMTTLDCADPSMQVGKRNESVSALQALALLNNGLMITMSKHFAARLDAEGGDGKNKIDRAFRLALGRAPTAEEQINLTVYATQHGLANACRVLFNLNEFAFVD